MALAYPRDAGCTHSLSMHIVQPRSRTCIPWVKHARIDSYNQYTSYSSFPCRLLMPVRLVWLTLVCREDGRILFLCRKRNCILTVCFQPLVKLILIEDVAFAWLSGRNRPVTELHVQRSQWDACVLGRFLHRHRLMAVLAYLMFPVLFLLLCQQGFQAHHLIPKLGDDLRKVVEC